MTQCAVYVYDDTLAAVTSTHIEILERDSFGKKLDFQHGTTLGPSEFGAKITLPNPPEPIIVWVDDTSGYFAPTSLGHLNGKETARLDVTLYALPVPPGGGGGGGIKAGASWQVHTRNGESEDDQMAAQPPYLIARHINQQVEAGEWSYSEALGVRSLVETATRALNIPQLDSELRDKLERWRTQLRSLGIAISAEAQAVQVATRTMTREA